MTASTLLKLYLSNSVLYSILIIAWYVLVVAGLWKMFEKAHEAGWKAIIPFYNIYVLCKIAWKPSMFWWYFACQILSGLLMFVGTNQVVVFMSTAFEIVAAIMVAVICYNISLAYGHGFGYFIGLYFLPFLFVLIIGFGGSKYVGNRYNKAQFA